MINLLGHKFGREWKLENAEDEEEATEGNHRNSLTSLRGHSHTVKLMIALT